jgi:large subunit ribosomal protein L32
MLKNSGQDKAPMAVQKSRKTPSKRGMHRSHSGLSKPAVSIDAKSGETHLRHRISREGYYRGRKILETKADAAAAEE